MHGEGTHVWPNGRKYVGSYKNNKKHGTGSYHYKDGSKYTGNWSSGKMHGDGVKESEKGSYKGKWMKGKCISKIALVMTKLKIVGAMKV